MIYYIDKKTSKIERNAKAQKHNARCRIYGISLVVIALTAAAALSKWSIQTSALQAVPVNVAVETYSDVKESESNTTVETATTTVQKKASKTAKISVKAFKGFCAPLKKGRITSSYGYRTNPVTGVYKLHGGLDIGASTGTKIYAIMDGVVEKSTKSSSYGYYVQIKHENGYVSLYAHCSKLLAEKGQTVKAGDVIALVGATGNTTGPHLHIEIRKNGKKLDPEILLGEIYK